MTGHYASAEETASVIRQATPDELWLNAQLDRIAPNRFDADVGESDALVKLVLELKAKLVNGPEVLNLVQTFRQCQHPDAGEVYDAIVSELHLDAKTTQGPRAGATS